MKLPIKAMHWDLERKESKLLMVMLVDACHSVGISFIPLVVESLGGWNCEAMETVKAIGCLQGQRLGLPPTGTFSHLFQQLAIRL